VLVLERTDFLEANTRPQCPSLPVDKGRQQADLQAVLGELGGLLDA
jgi:hypothetical protein